MAEKARYWVAVCYPENMRKDWQESIGNILQLPYAYCIHNKDCTTSKEVRKDHVHIMVCFPNTTTKKSALTLFNKLSEVDCVCCSSCEQVHNVRFMYNYLIHDTEDCRKKRKYLYDSSCRITGNNFDIGTYEQLSTTDKIDMLMHVSDMIMDLNLENLAELYIQIKQSDNERAYFEVCKSHAGWLSGLCKANYLRNHEGKKR